MFLILLWYVQTSDTTTHRSDFILVLEWENIVGFNPLSVRQRSQEELVTLEKDSPQLHANQARAEIIRGDKCYKMNTFPLGIP